MKSTVLPTLAEVRTVVFYKVDEITTDLICCQVTTAEGKQIFHEDMSDWDLLIAELGRLPQFRTDWFSQVSQPPFAESQFVAFSR